MGRRLVWDGHDPEARPVRRGDPGVGILEGDPFLSRHSEMVQDPAVKIRLGLGRRHILPAGRKIEERKQPQAPQMPFDMGVR